MLRSPIVLVGGGLSALVVGASWWMAVHPRQTAGAHGGVLLAAGAVTVAAAILGRHRQRTGSGQWLLSSARATRADRLLAVGVAGWTVVIGSVVAWDVVSFVAQRGDLPTLSRLIGHVTAHQFGRGALFAVWLGLGLLLILGGRRQSGPALNADGHRQ